MTGSPRSPNRGVGREHSLELGEVFEGNPSLGDGLRKAVQKQYAGGRSRSRLRPKSVCGAELSEAETSERGSRSVASSRAPSRRVRRRRVDRCTSNDSVLGKAEESPLHHETGENNEGNESTLAETEKVESRRHRPKTDTRSKSFSPTRSRPRGSPEPSERNVGMSRTRSNIRRDRTTRNHSPDRERRVRREKSGDCERATSCHRLPRTASPTLNRRDESTQRGPQRKVHRTKSKGLEEAVRPDCRRRDRKAAVKPKEMSKGENQIHVFESEKRPSTETESRETIRTSTKVLERMNSTLRQPSLQDLQVSEHDSEQPQDQPPARVAPTRMQSTLRQPSLKDLEDFEAENTNRVAPSRRNSLLREPSLQDLDESKHKDDSLAEKRPSTGLSSALQKQTLAKLSLEEKSPRSLTEADASFIENASKASKTSRSSRGSKRFETSSDDEDDCGTVLQFDPTQHDNVFRVKQVVKDSAGYQIDNSDGTQVNGEIAEIFDPVGDAQQLQGTKKDAPIFDFLESGGESEFANLQESADAPFEPDMDDGFGGCDENERPGRNYVRADSFAFMYPSGGEDEEDDDEKEVSHFIEAPKEISSRTSSFQLHHINAGEHEDATEPQQITTRKSFDLKYPLGGEDEDDDAKIVTKDQQFGSCASTSFCPAEDEDEQIERFSKVVSPSVRGKSSERNTRIKGRSSKSQRGKKAKTADVLAKAMPNAIDFPGVGTDREDEPSTHSRKTFSKRSTQKKSTDMKPREHSDQSSVPQAMLQKMESGLYVVSGAETTENELSPPQRRKHKVKKKTFFKKERSASPGGDEEEDGPIPGMNPYLAKTDAGKPVNAATVWDSEVDSPVKKGSKRISMGLASSIGRYFGRSRRQSPTSGTDTDHDNMSVGSVGSRLFRGKKHHQLLGDDSSSNCSSMNPF